MQTDQTDLNCDCVILFYVCVLVDGEWTAVEGGGTGMLRLQACMSCDALLYHQISAVWENSFQTYHTGEQESCQCLSVCTCIYLLNELIESNFEFSHAQIMCA